MPELMSSQFVDSATGLATGASLNSAGAIKFSVFTGCGATSTV